MDTQKKTTVILGCSGSVACIKVPLLASMIHNKMPHVKVLIVPTIYGQYFLESSEAAVSLKKLLENENSEVRSENPNKHLTTDEWEKCMENVIAFIVAPLGANLMAKLSDPSWHSSRKQSNLEIALDVFLRKRKSDSAPLFLAPAMNGFMWNSAITAKNLLAIRAQCGDRNYYLIPPINKISMCGESGFGPMEEPAEVVDIMINALDSSKFAMLKPEVIKISSVLFDFLQEPPSSNLDDGEYCRCLRLCVSQVVKKSSSFNLLIGLDEGISDELASGLREQILSSPMQIEFLKSIVQKFCDDLSTEAKFSLNSSFPNQEIKLVSNDSLREHFLPESSAGKDFMENSTCFSDADEWKLWKKREDPVLHILLRQWADILLIINPSLKFLHGISSGICDSLLGCVIRAWDFSCKGFFIVLTDSYIAKHFDEMSTKLVQNVHEIGMKIVIFCSKNCTLKDFTYCAKK